jgi:tripeptide aminopeptidase
VLALEGHGTDRVFTSAVGSLRVRLTVTGPGGHSWWDRGRPSAVHELVRLLHAMIGTAPAALSVNVGLIDGGTGVNAIAAQASATVEWRVTDQAALDRQEAALAELAVSPGLPTATGDGSTDANAALAAGIPAVALGCCEGEDMHAPTERIRVGSIGAGAEQLRAALTEILERNQEC